MIDDVNLAQAIAGSMETANNNGIATLDESVLSTAIEASLQDQQFPRSQENQQSLEPIFSYDSDNYDDAFLAQDPQSEVGIEKCPHVKDAVKQANFRKYMAEQNKDWDHCLTCVAFHTKFKNVAKAMMGPLAVRLQKEFPADELPSEALWICLTCGEINCGRALKEHAVEHAVELEKSKNSSHPLAMNLASLECW
jgi:hypothetical protein